MLVHSRRARPLGAGAAAAGPARADENLLRGPHPFRRDNQVSAHVLMASGRADTMSGTKLAFDYDYKLTGGWSPLWLDLAVNAQHGACSSAPSASAVQPRHAATSTRRSAASSGCS